VRCTIRHITRRPNGGVSQSERSFEVEGNRITLGCGTNNEVFLKDKELRVNYEHAELVLRDGRATLHALGNAVMRVGKKTVGQVELAQGTEVEVGPYRIGRLPSEAGTDLTLAVELVAPQAPATPDTLVAPGGVRLHGTWANKRLLSWLLFLLLAVVGLGLPIYAYSIPKPKPPVVGQPPVLATLDRIWISGELSSSHRFLTNNCRACHDQAFTPIRAETCASCHADAKHHFDVARFTFANFDPVGCTGCHNEHVGPTGVLPTHGALCAGCHRNLKERQPETMLLDTADFGTAHPEFRPSVLTDPTTVPPTIVRAALGSADFPKERSNLRFPHDKHLVEAGVNSPNGKRRLGCADCHQAEPGARFMQPIRMDKHCAVCHRLQFDKDAPARVLPHGKPDEVIAVVNDYYAAKALRETAAGGPRPLPEAPAQPPGVRRRAGLEAPGARTRGQAQEQARARSPLPEAQFVSEQTLRNIFGRSLCGVCHVTTPPEESASGRWEVQPARVTAVWMPKAHFDHAAHTTVDCGECHKAQASKSAEAVLMPPIATCRNCHAGELALAAVPSTCVMCHDYHRRDLGPMITPAAQATAEPSAGGPGSTLPPARSALAATGG
jgi:predicted CXXCH cytochrome family protein